MAKETIPVLDYSTSDKDKKKKINIQKKLSTKEMMDRIRSVGSKVAKEKEEESLKKQVASKLESDDLRRKRAELHQRSADKQKEIRQLDKRRKAQQELRNKEYNDWLSDEASKKESEDESWWDSFLRNTAKSAKEYEDGDFNFEGLINSGISNLIFEAIDQSADALDGGTNAHISELTGKQSMKSLEQQEIEAQKYFDDIDLNIAKIQKQKDLFTETIPTITENGELDPKYADKLRQYDEAIAALEYKKQNAPADIKQLSDMHKRRVVSEYKLHNNPLSFFGDAISDKLAGISILSPASEAELKQQVRDNRTAKYALEYDKALQRKSDVEKQMQRGDKIYTDPDALNKDLEKAVHDWTMRQNDPYSESTNEDNPIIKYENRINNLNKKSKELEAEKNELEKERVNTVKFQQDYHKYVKVSESFKQGKQEYSSASLLDPSYWRYNFMGMVGSSNSSKEQMISNAINTAAVIGSFFTDGATSAVVNIGTAVATTPLDIAGATAENYGEVGDKRVSNILSDIKASKDFGESIMNDLMKKSIVYWQKQGLSNQEIRDRLGMQKDDKGKWHVNKTGEQAIIQDLIANRILSTSPIVNKSLITSTAGLKAQFDADNMRTMGEMPIQKLTQIMPIDKVLSHSIGVRIDKAASRILNKESKNIVTNTGGKNVVTSAVESTESASKAVKNGERYANGFKKQTASDAAKKGWEVGSEIGDALGFGYVGHIVGGVTGTTVNTGAYLAKRTLLTPKLRGFIDNAEQAVMHKYLNVYDKLIGDSKWRKLAAKYANHAFIEANISAVSEAAEEGVQYLNSKEDFAAKYGYDGMSIGDMIANDLYQGSRVFGAYMSLLGLGSSELDNDVEYWENLKGGFALGGRTPQLTSAILFVGDTKAALREYNATAMITKDALMSRETEKSNRTSNSEMAKYIMSGKGRGDALIRAIETMLDQDRRRETPNYTQEDYDAKLEDAYRIASLAKSNEIRKKLEAKGFRYGTDEYAHAIADLANLQSQKETNYNQAKEAENELSRLYFTTEFSNRRDKIVNDVLRDDVRTQIYISRQRVNAANKAKKDFEEYAKKNDIEEGSKEYEEQLKLRVDKAKEYAEQEAKADLRMHVFQRTAAVNRLQALLKIKAQMNTIEDWFNLGTQEYGLKTKRPDAKQIVDHIEARIKEAKEILAQYEGTSKDISDDEVLKYMEGMDDVIKYNADEIQQLEVASAMLGADKVITEQYLNQFEEGLSKDDDGKYSFSGKKNNYKRRIETIMKANKENEALNWMVNDIQSGDAIVNLMDIIREELAAEKKKEAPKPSEEIVEEKTTETKPSEPVEEKESKWDATREHRKSVLEKSRKKYEERRKKAKEIRDRNRAAINRYRRGVTKNGSVRLNATVPFLDLIADAVNELIYLAKDGVYKFDELVTDLKEIVQDVDIDENITAVRKAYIKAYTKLKLKKASFLNNLTPPAELAELSVPKLPKKRYQTPIVTTIDKAKFIQDRLKEDADKIVESVSTYYDAVIKEGDKYYIYPNTAEIELHRKTVNLNDDIRRVSEEVKEAVKSESEFRKLLEKYAEGRPGFPVEDYLKLREVEGVDLAIARRLFNDDENDSVITGAAIRRAVIDIFSGREDEVEPFGTPELFEDFVQNIKTYRESIDAAGLKVLDTEYPLYGINKSGLPMVSLVDILLMDEHGNTYVTDVLYSYTPIHLRWNTSPGGGASYTIHERESYMLHLIETVLTNKFNLNVVNLLVIPVVFGNVLNVEEYIEIPVTQDKSIQEIQEEEELNDQINSLLKEINQITSDYNKLVDLLQEYGDNSCIRLGEQVKKEYSSSKERQAYIEQLHSTYDQLLSMRKHVSDRILRHMNDKRSQLSEDIKSEIPAELLTIDSMKEALDRACEELDIMLSNKSEVDPLRLYGCLQNAQQIILEILNDELSDNVDIFEQQELITQAYETLYKNKQKLNGKIAIYNWWLTSISNGLQDNSNLHVEGGASNIAIKYNKFINHWLDQFGERFFEGTSLDNDEDSQRWYSTILNNYFSVLLDNAENFAKENQFNDFLVLNMILLNVARGREFIRNFNISWNIDPDPNYDGPLESDVDKINAIDVRWVDKFNVSETHSPSFNEMSNGTESPGKFYYWMSIKPDFADKVEYTFRNVDGKLYVDLKYFDKQLNRLNYCTLSFETNLSAFPEKTLEKNKARFISANRGNKKFAKKILAMLDYIQKHPGCDYTIKCDITTNKGSITQDPDNTLHSVFKFLMSNKSVDDLYSVRILKEDGFGIISTTVANKVPIRSIRTGNALQSVIDEHSDFVKDNLEIPDGTIVYLYTTPQGKQIPQALTPSKIGKDAGILVELMQMYISGQTLYDGYDIMSLLKQRLYIQDGTKRTSSYNNISHRFYFANNKVYLGNEDFDLSDPGKKQRLITIISGLNTTLDKTYLSKNLRDTDSILSELDVRFRENASVQEIRLPNGLVFKRDDFQHLNKTGNPGSTWLGYLLRNGMLQTQAIRLGHTDIRFGNPRLVSKTTEAPVEKPITQVRQEGGRRRSILNFNGNDFGTLGMTVSDDSEMVNRTEAEQDEFIKNVNDYFDEMFGNHDDVSFEGPENKYVRMAASNNRVAGLCTSQAIIMSRFAPDTAMFHEAFHKILELILPSEERESFYKSYRKAHWWRKLSEREVAEGICDLFVEYFRNKQQLKVSKGLHKIKPFFRQLALYIGLAARFLGNTRNIIKLYSKAENKEFKNSTISLENIDRFNKLFGEGLNYTVKNTDTKTTAEFRYIPDSGHLEHMVNALVYWVLYNSNIDTIDADVSNINLNLPKEIIDYLCNVDEQNPNEVDLAFREVFEPILKLRHGKKGDYYETVYPRYEVLKKKINDKISAMLGADVKMRLEDEDEDEKLLSLNIDHFGKAAYLYDRLEGVTKKVKLFFATVPYTVLERRKNGENVEQVAVLDYSKNLYDSPQFIPLEEVFNIVISDCKHISSIDELLEEFKRKADGGNSKYKVLYNKLKALYDKAYSYDENDNLSIDHDAESYLIQIATCVHCQDIPFTVTNVKKGPSGGKRTTVNNASQGRDVRLYPVQWTQNLISGVASVFQRGLTTNGEFVLLPEAGLQKDEGGHYIKGTDIFSRTVSFIYDIVSNANNPQMLFTISNNTYMKDDVQSVYGLMCDIVDMFNNIGIDVNYDEVQYILEKKYGNVSFDSICKWLSQSEKTNSIREFLNQLQNFVRPDNTVNKDVVLNGYKNFAFIYDLAQYKGEYIRNTTGKSTLLLNGKTGHSVTQNNTISHNVEQFNTHQKDNFLVKLLMRYSYNLTEVGGVPVGSIIMKMLNNNEDFYLQTPVHIGSKTDNRGDGGSEYSDAAETDDYMSKYGLLRDGAMVSPTLADKGTYQYITGVQIPGMLFKAVKVVLKDEKGNIVIDENGKPVEVEKMVAANAPTVHIFNGQMILRPSDRVLDQLLQYAYTEVYSICECFEQLGMELPELIGTPDNPIYRKQGLRKLEKDELIKNYHTGKNPNGTRFFSLKEIVVPMLDPKDPSKVILKTITLNRPGSSAKKCLEDAQEYFFSKSLKEKYDILMYTLHTQHMLEVEKAEQLGIVTRRRPSFKNAEGQDMFFKDDNPKALFTAESDLLDEEQIEILVDHFMTTTKAFLQKEGAIKTPRDFAIKEQICRSLAISALLSDATDRAIISMEEFKRCFSGDPRFFKVRYDDNNDRVDDDTFDMQKRIGGLVSTGDDNVKNLPMDEQEYVCTEIKDYEVSSHAEISAHVHEMFEISAVRDIFSDLTLNYTIASNMSTLEILELCNESLDSHREKGLFIPNIMTNPSSFINERIKKLTYTQEGGVYNYLIATTLQMQGILSGSIKIGDLEIDDVEQFVKNNGYDHSEKLSYDEAYIAYCEALDGAHAYYKDHGDDYLARLFDSLGKLVRKQDADTRRLQKQLKPSVKKAIENALNYADNLLGINGKSKINVGDGGAYVTDKTYEIMLRKRGAFNTKIARAFEILRADATKYSWKQQKEAWKLVQEAINIVPTKYTAYGFREHSLNGEKCSDIAVPYYNKFALFPLFPCIATGKMKELYEKMDKEGVDMLMFDSCVKLGSQGAMNHDSNMDKMLSTPFATYKQNFSFIRRQLNTDPEEGDRIPIGTQMVKIFMLSLRLGRQNYTDTVTGDLKSGQLIFDELMDAIRELHDIGIEDLFDMFTKEGTQVPTIDMSLPVSERYREVMGVLSDNIDPVKLSNFLVSQLKSKNADSTTVEAIQLNENGTDTNVPLAATTNSKWIESIIISTTNKRLIDINTPGSSFVQRSVFAMEGSSKAGEGGSIQGDENMSPTINNGKRLLMINEEGSMDAVISIDFFANILPKGLSFDEAKQWLIDHRIIGPNAKANVIGYRIPTQAQSSIHALRFVDVIPATKTTVILPEEFTKITGSDFDIDHLYLASINIQADASKPLTRKQICENKIINTMLTVLKDTDNSMHTLYRSIDDDTKLVEDPADEIPDLQNNKYHSWNDGTLHEQVTRKNDYITGSVGIGPYALNVTGHELARLTGLHFSHSKFTESLDLERLDKLVDDLLNYISSWLSGYINAHVDIVKKPYISKENINQFTYNMCNLFVRTGHGNFGLWFLCQPVVAEMANMSIKQKSEYIKRYSFADRQRMKAADLLRFKDKYGIDASDQAIDDYVNNPDKNERKIANAKFVMDNVEALKYISTHADTLNPQDKITAYRNGVKETITVAKMQQAAFYAWHSFAKYSQALGKLTQHTKIDTRKQGKTFLEMIKYYEGFKEIFYDEEGTVLFDKKTLDNMLNSTWIGYKTETAIKIPLAILKGQTFNADDNFINALVDFCKRIMGASRISQVPNDMLNIMSDHMVTYIKAQYFADYARNVLGYNDFDFRGLFIPTTEQFEEEGKKRNRYVYSMNHRLGRLLNAIKNNPRYSRLQTNSFIKLLYQVAGDDSIISNNGIEITKPQFVSIGRSSDSSSVADAVRSGWKDMLMDHDRAVRKFAEDMIMYAFFTSGEFKGWDKLLKYVPYEWISGQIHPEYQSFGDYIRETLNSIMSFPDHMLDDIVMNNFTNDEICPRMQENNPDGNPNFVTSTNKNILIGKRSDKGYVGYFAIRSSDYKYRVFKLIGLHKGYPVYIRLSTKGYHDKNLDIYEYGFNFNYEQNQVVRTASVKAIQDAVRFIEESKVVFTEETSSNDIFVDQLRNILKGKVLVEDLLKAENPDDVMDDIIDSFTGQKESEAIEVLNSDKTILSNEELAQWNANGVGPNPRILVASEHTDPVFFADQIVDMIEGRKPLMKDKLTRITREEWEALDKSDRWQKKLGSEFQYYKRERVESGDRPEDFAGLYIVTKHDGLPLKKILQTKIPKLIHFSITGQGGTKWEPHVMKPEDMLDRIEDLIKQGLDPKIVTVRIDPILPGVTKPSQIKYIVSRAAAMGIKNIRFSVMDAYPSIIKDMQNLGYNFEEKYGRDSEGKVNKHAKQDVIDSIAKYMVQLGREYGVNIGTCAENINMEGISKEGCLSVRAVNELLGTSIEDKGNDNNKYREGCSCFGGKTDMLAYSDKCKSMCKYCYAHHANAGNGVRYYDNNGNLVRSGLTMTRDSLKKQPKWTQATKHWSREEVQNDPETLYIFTDNTDRTSGGNEYGDGWYAQKYGKGGYGTSSNPTSAIIRGLDNAAPISTMRWFYKNHPGVSHPFRNEDSEALWSDKYFDEFKAVIDDELATIKRMWDSGKYKRIVTPGGDGIFSKNTKITKERTPRIHDYLSREIKKLIDYVNGSDSNNTAQTMNFHHGAGDNIDLSNFEIRPFDNSELKTNDPNRIIGSVSLLFATDSSIKFLSVEQAFQLYKLANIYSSYEEEMDRELWDKHENKEISDLEFENARAAIRATTEPVLNAIYEILNTTDGYELRKIGRRRFDNIDPKVWLWWDEHSSEVMKVLLKTSFEQNPQAAQRLIATGDVKLTHLSKALLKMTPEQLAKAKQQDKWIDELPRLMMEVRDELRGVSAQQPTTNTEYTMHSGGANGSDLTWGSILKEYGITLQNHYYHGEKSENNAPGGNVKISDKDYEEGRTEVAKAAKYNWGYKYDKMKDDRLVRNWAQVKYADAVFAIGHLVKPGERVFPNLKDDTRVATHPTVQGGTGYAVGMAILHNKPVYVYDQERKKWYKCINERWLASDVPTLTKDFAAIGTRQLNEAGKLAIRDVCEKTFNTKPQQPTTDEISESELQYLASLDYADDSHITIVKFKQQHPDYDLVKTEHGYKPVKKQLSTTSQNPFFGPWGPKKRIGKSEEKYITEERRINENNQHWYDSYEDYGVPLLNEIRDHILAVNELLKNASNTKNVTIKESDYDKFKVPGRGKKTDGKDYNIIDAFAESDSVISQDGDNIVLTEKAYITLKYITEHPELIAKIANIEERDISYDNGIAFANFGDQDWVNNEGYTLEEFVSDSESEEEAENLYEYRYRDSRQLSLFSLEDINKGKQNRDNCKNNK